MFVRAFFLAVAATTRRARSLRTTSTMAHAASGIGLQNPAFFVGRAELLDWVNGLLNLRLTKVEQVRISPDGLILTRTNERLGADGRRLARAGAPPTATSRPAARSTRALSTRTARRETDASLRSPCLKSSPSEPSPSSRFPSSRKNKVASGAVHCQILDACHPGVVNMSKVNFDAKNEYDMVNNYKQLQIVFDKLKITRNIEVGKLVKARPLDNLEFLQWMKHYYDTATGGVKPVDYDGDVRRQQSKGASAAKRQVGGVGPGAKRSANVHATSAARNGPGPTRGANDAEKSTSSRGVVRGTVAASNAAELKALGAENAELKLAVERTEQEREFYFEKLQDIEFLCQRPEFANTALARVVEKILYFTEGKPDVDAIIEECAAATARETPSAAEETRNDGNEEEETVATPTFDEAAALGAALENECIDLTAPSSPLAACAPTTELTPSRAPLSPQPTNV